MDFTNYTILEPLKLLRPPVKRDFRTGGACSFFNNRPNEVLFMRKWRKKPKKRTKTVKNKRSVEASTSLILQKISSKKLINKYSVGSYTDIKDHTKPQNHCNHGSKGTEKPIIKVIVIPHTKQEAEDKSEAENIHNNSQKNTGINFVETKNVYLFFDGRKKKKVFEIKTNDEDFLEQSIKDDNVENLFNGKSKQFLKSIAMDNIKKEQDTGQNELQGIKHVCRCICSGGEVMVKEIDTGMSRVKIYGQIGLTEDDRYVLKCAATVDDQPVLSSSKIGQKVSLTGIPLHNDFKFHKESDTQTNIINVVHSPSVSIEVNRRDSQAIQVNLELPKNKKKSQAKSNNQMTQCDCLCKNDVPKNKNVAQRKTEDTGKELKACNSPFVVISVYPSTDNKSAMNTIPCSNKNINRKTEEKPQSSPKISLNRVSQLNTAPEIFTRNKTGTNLKNFSVHVDTNKDRLKKSNTVKNKSVTRKQNNIKDSSPIRSNVATDLKKQERKNLPEKTSPSSPNRSPKQSPIRSNILTDVKKLERKTVKEKTLPPSPNKSPKQSPIRSNISTDVNKQEPKTVRQKTMLPSPNKSSKQSPSRNTQNFRASPQSRPRDKGVNTDLTKQTPEREDKLKKNKGRQPKNKKIKTAKPNVSTVSVNIESENEYYDVSFNQGMYTTNVAVRKRLKDTPWNLNKSGSLENYYCPIPQKSQPANIRNSDCLPAECGLSLTENKSRLQPRDSLEISHRIISQEKLRENGKSIECCMSNYDFSEFYAPIKHYTGDSCSICNPIQRDLEIQKLLGISRGLTSKNDLKTKYYNHKEFLTQQCYNDNNCLRTVVAEVTLCNSTICSESCHQLNNCEHALKDYKRVKPANSNQSTLLDSKLFLKELEKRTTTDALHVQKPDYKSHSKDANKHSSQYSDRILKEHVKGSKKRNKNRCPRQMILNRNVQIFLEIEKFIEQKPINLSKKEYEKVKKAIGKAIYDEDDARSHGDKNKRSKIPKFNVSTDDGLEKKNTFTAFPCKCEDIIINQEPENKEIVKKITSRSDSNIFISKARTKTKSRDHKHSVKQISTQTESLKSKCKNILRSMSSLVQSKSSRLISPNRCEEGRKAFLLCDAKDLYATDKSNEHKVNTQHAVSSIEVRYTSIEMKCVNFSTQKAFESKRKTSSSNPVFKEPLSIETLFNGHRKYPTPNIGTSVLTIDLKSVKGEFQSCRSFEEPKKPFLRRIMSCLVMRAEKVVPKIITPKLKPSTVANTMDSYDISTSLGAVDLNSSLYDTSASFYSNHSIHPEVINNKMKTMKRSFFSSMREFLINRRA